jgi:hypothetical protein
MGQDDAGRRRHRCTESYCCPKFDGNLKMCFVTNYIIPFTGARNPDWTNYPYLFSQPSIRPSPTRTDPTNNPIAVIEMPPLDSRRAMGVGVTCCGVSEDAISVALPTTGPGVLPGAISVGTPVATAVGPGAGVLVSRGWFDGVPVAAGTRVRVAVADGVPVSGGRGESVGVAAGGPEPAIVGVADTATVDVAEGRVVPVAVGGIGVFVELRTGVGVLVKGTV